LSCRAFLIRVALESISGCKPVLCGFINMVNGGQKKRWIKNGEKSRHIRNFWLCVYKVGEKNAVCTIYAGFCKRLFGARIVLRKLRRNKWELGFVDLRICNDAMSPLTKEFRQKNREFCFFVFCHIGLLYVYSLYRRLMIGNT